MKIVELFFKKPFLDDPWMSATFSLLVVVVAWLALWFAFCVIAYRYYLLPAVFPENPDIAYLFGHLFALGGTVTVGYVLLRQYFGLTIFALGLALPLLGLVFKIFKANAASRPGRAPEAAATTAGS